MKVMKYMFRKRGMKMCSHHICTYLHIAHIIHALCFVLDLPLLDNLEPAMEEHEKTKNRD